MAVATAHSTHLPPLGVHQREQVGHQPQVMLVEPVDLPSLGKHLHSTVVGPLLRPLHLQLAGLIDSWREPADAVAERAVAIGLIPDRQSTAVAAGTSLRSPERDEHEARVVVRELTSRVTTVAECRRGCLGRLDAVTQDVVFEVVDELEELWMIRTQSGEERER